MQCSPINSQYVGAKYRLMEYLQNYPALTWLTRGTDAAVPAATAVDNAATAFATVCIAAVAAAAAAACRCRRSIRHATPRVVVAALLWLLQPPPASPLSFPLSLPPNTFTTRTCELHVPPESPSILIHLYHVQYQLHLLGEKQMRYSLCRWKSHQ